MKKRIALALCTLVIAAGGIGMSSLSHEEPPVSEELLAEAMAEEEPEEEIEIEEEEVAEFVPCQKGCILETGHEGECVMAEKDNVEVVLKSTSMERDLKVKFVSKATGKVISGAAFKMKVTSPSNTTKEYSDHDNDGIIWVKDIDGGSYTVAMVDLEGYVTAKTLKAEVKKKIEYKVVEIADEVKNESQVEVSKEDAEFGGADKDDSTSNTEVPKDTVEFVASSKKETEKKTDKPLVDKFGNTVHEKQKLDALGQPMFAKIVSESAKYHKDTDNDGICNRCNACMGHKDVDGDKKCDVCKADVGADVHKHSDSETDKDCNCDTCGAFMAHGALNEHKVCTVCGQAGEGHTHTDSDNDQKCDTCQAAVGADVHQHVDSAEDTDCNCDSCGAFMAHGTLNEHKVCTVCGQAGEGHTHTDSKNDQKCDTCQAAVGTDVHQHVDSAEDTDCNCDSCGAFMAHGTLNEHKVCTVCGQAGEAHTHTDSDNDQKCDTCQAEVGEGVHHEVDDSVSLDASTAFMMFRPFSFLRASSGDFITYDKNSAPIYDESSPVVYETVKETTYYGWQTLDGATYYFDKNGEKVTGQQVIQGVSYTFSSEGVRSGTIGIDVSKYQTGINWTKVKNAGINFVIIRCGYRGYGSGVLVEDPMYRSHIQGAKAAGLRVGVYFFSQAINEAEAVEEASMAVNLANKYGINMPIAIDSEYANGGHGRADKLSKSERTKITKAFCNTVKSAGHTPMVYASKSWFGSHLDVGQLSGYRIWVAHYADKCGYTGTYHIWQNTSSGKVDGVPGRVDMNISSI